MYAIRSYYAKSAEELATLQSPVLGHFGTLDKNIDAEMVGGFEKSMAAAGKSDLTVHWYVADHAFANPSGARYDEEDAVGEQDRLVHVVGDHEHGLLGGAPDLDQLVLDHAAGQRIEGAERFVQQQQLRAGGEGAGDADALAHTARNNFV